MTVIKFLCLAYGLTIGTSIVVNTILNAAALHALKESKPIPAWLLFSFGFSMAGFITLQWL